MTTPAQAVAAYLRANRPDCTVVRIHEDADDYLAELAYDGPVRIGEEWVFVSKASGQVWTAAPGEVFDKVAKMT